MLDGHPELKAYLEKVRKDNLRFLVSAVAWNLMVSAVPMAMGIVALSNVLFQGSSQQREIVRQLSRAFQGVLSPRYLEHVVNLTVHHSGLLIVVTLLTALWGAWNLGFALSEAFDAMFEVGERPFLQEKLIDIGMFFVLMLLAFVIVAATTTQGVIARTILESPLPNLLLTPVRTLVSLGCGFLLFAVIYAVYPNTDTRLRLEHVWRGSLLAAILFQILTYIWPLYEAHFSKYGGLLFPLLVLILWIYFFSLILVLGGEVVALSAIKRARDRGERVGPSPSGGVPEGSASRLAG